MALGHVGVGNVVDGELGFGVFAAERALARTVGEIEAAVLTDFLVVVLKTGDDLGNVIANEVVVVG